MWKWCRKKKCWSFQTKVISICLKSWWTWISFKSDDYCTFISSLFILHFPSHRRHKLDEVEKHERLPPHVNCVRFYRAWEERLHLYIQTELCLMRYMWWIYMYQIQLLIYMYMYTCTCTWYSIRIIVYMYMRTCTCMCILYRHCLGGCKSSHKIMCIYCTCTCICLKKRPSLIYIRITHVHYTL